MAIANRGRVKFLQVGRGRFQVATELPPSEVLDALLFDVPLTGADGVETEFASPVTVRRDPNGRAQAILCRGAAIELYDTDDPPEAGAWTLRVVNGVQTVVVGTAPAADEYFGFLWVLTA